MKGSWIALGSIALGFAAACGDADDTASDAPPAALTCPAVAPVDAMAAALSTPKLQLTDAYEGHLTVLTCDFGADDRSDLLEILIYRQGTEYTPYFDSPCTTQKTSSVVNETFEIDCAGFPEVDFIARNQWVRVRLHRNGAMEAAREVARDINAHLLAL
jgi:hypothetical protein